MSIKSGNGEMLRSATRLMALAKAELDAGHIATAARILREAAELTAAATDSDEAHREPAIRPADSKK
jgi:hypothetical protein